MSLDEGDEASPVEANARETSSNDFNRTQISQHSQEQPRDKPNSAARPVVTAASAPAPAFSNADVALTAVNRTATAPSTGLRHYLTRVSPVSSGTASTTEYSPLARAQPQGTAILQTSRSLSCSICRTVSV